METKLFAQIHEHLNGKGISSFYQPANAESKDIEILGIPFKKYEGGFLDNIDYTMTAAQRDNAIAFIICAAIHPILDDAPKYSKKNGMVLMNGAKEFMSTEMPYLTDGTDVPIKWVIEERVTISGKPYFALEGSCMMLVSGQERVSELCEFMEGWLDFPIVAFQELKTN